MNERRDLFYGETKEEIKFYRWTKEEIKLYRGTMKRENMIIIRDERKGAKLERGSCNNLKCIVFGCRKKGLGIVETIERK